MLKVQFLVILSILLFFILHFGYTQKIYTYNNINSYLIFAVIFPALLIAFNFKRSQEDLFIIVSFSSIFLIHYLLLFLLKKNYKKLNSFLIRKNYISKKYENKDYTFVIWRGYLQWSAFFPVDDYWNKKPAHAPSGFDHLLSFLLLVTPVLFTGLVCRITGAFN